MVKLCEHKGFGKDVMVLINITTRVGECRAAILVIVGRIIVIESHDPSATAGRTASTTTATDGRKMEVRVPKMIQSRNDIPIHEVSGSGHDVALKNKLFYLFIGHIFLLPWTEHYIANTFYSHEKILVRSR